jgi:hypothetical protein
MKKADPLKKFCEEFYEKKHYELDYIIKENLVKLLRLKGVTDRKKGFHEILFLSFLTVSFFFMVGLVILKDLVLAFLFDYWGVVFVFLASVGIYHYLNQKSVNSKKEEYEKFKLFFIEETIRVMRSEKDRYDLLTFVEKEYNVDLFHK